jgi:hypothetical protein
MGVAPFNLGAMIGRSLAYAILCIEEVNANPAEQLTEARRNARRVNMIIPMEEAYTGAAIHGHSSSELSSVYAKQAQCE